MQKSQKKGSRHCLIAVGAEKGERKKKKSRLLSREKKKAGCPF